MARGTDGLLCKLSDGGIHKMSMNRGPITNWDKPIWVSNKRLQDIEGYHEAIPFSQFMRKLKQDNSLITATIKSYKCNQKIINVKDSLKTKDNLSIAFFRNRNAFWLITVPAKTLDQIRASDDEYYMPLLMVVKKMSFVPFNL